MDKHLDELFNKARAQAPKASFADTVAQFNLTIAATGGSAAITSWLFKALSMINSLVVTGVLVTTVIVVFGDDRPKKRDAVKSVADSTYQDIPSPGEPLIFQSATSSFGEETTGGKTAFNTRVNDDESVAGETDSVGNHKIDYLLRQKKQAPIWKIQSRKIADKMHSYVSSAWPEKAITALPNSIKPFVTDIPKPKGMLFTLTELSSETDFQNIEKLAADAGVTFYSHVHHSKQRYRGQLLISDFVVEMTIDGTEITSRVKVEVPKRGRFAVDLGWFVSEDGKAVRLTDDITVTEAISKYPRR
ncbi:hypothetical protein QQ020_07465 [Fulvivirgaceae bacterium BMA12]|uniref:Uncharacterized protein n=1 Tax=Agaribacillus aureus TaxID=3051825 RepID=A0ABT8L2E9_9BACT|nr:hypothetical protein [Fulvivirgaceae bacterium BMA12]